MKSKMHCVMCENQKPISMAKVNRYKFVESGLDNVYLNGVFQGVCPKCGEVYVTIPRPQQLSKAIRDVLIRKKGTLTGSEIRFLRKSVGWDAQKMYAALRMRRETYSRIENGKQDVTPAVDFMVRLVVKDMARDTDYSLVEEIDSGGGVDIEKELDMAVSGTKWSVAA